MCSAGFFCFLPLCTETCNFYRRHGGLWGGSLVSKTEQQREEMLERLRRLADRKVNDAVKLAFLDPEAADRVDDLDLSGLVELKRTDKSFEARFVDQIKVLEMMRELMREDESQAAAEFFRALNGAADGGEEA